MTPRSTATAAMPSTTRGWRRTASAYEGAAASGGCSLGMSVVLLCQLYDLDFGSGYAQPQRGARAMTASDGATHGPGPAGDRQWSGLGGGAAGMRQRAILAAGAAAAVALTAAT